MSRDLRIPAILALVLGLLTLAACGALPFTSPTPEVAAMSLGTPAISTPVGTSVQATLEAALTQQSNNADAQAAATAEVMRANAQATMNSANATLNAALIQEQNEADIIAAQVAATAAIVRANAQATLVSAGSTQSAALTQDAIRQTQVQYNLQVTAGVATQNAIATITQQNINSLAVSTQTAVANQIATQTQSAVETSQRYTEQARQLEGQRQEPIIFLWRWCPPIFIILLAGLALWGLWRWLQIQQANQRILENPVDKLQAPAAEVKPPQQNDSLPYIEGDIVDSRHRLIKPDDQMRRWLDEVKRKLIRSDKKDDDDNTGD